MHVTFMPMATVALVFGLAAPGLAVAQERGADRSGPFKAVLQVVRRFLVKHRVTWTTLLNGQGAGDFAAAYRVEQIPANFLVGRDGKIIAVEQSGEMLERAVAHALGGPEDSRGN